jgi:DNA-binding response OmpR family regulator
MNTSTLTTPTSPITATTPTAPATPANPTGPATEPDPGPLRPPRPLRVLAVVRDHGIRDAVAAALAGEGHEIETTEHSAAALARIAEWQPAVILLDMRLPATDRGASMARYRHAAGPGVAIIGLAGFPVPDTAAQAAQIGADDGLAMPLDLDELRALVRWHAAHHPTGDLTAGEAGDDESGDPTPPEQPANVAIGDGAARAVTGGPAAIVEALRAFAAQSARHTPWMTAADLAQRVGAAGVHDPQFEADVQALYAAGTVRLMSGGSAGGGSFFEVMLVPPAPPTPPPSLDD